MRIWGRAYRPYVTLVLLLAWVHAWTPRAWWHWHDCNASAPTSVCAAHTCTYAPGQQPSAPPDAPLLAPEAADDGCGFSFASFHLPPLGPLGAPLFVLLLLGRLPWVSPPARQILSVGRPARTGRAPPRN